MLRFASDRVYRVYSRWFAGVVFLCSATLHVCQTMYRSKQFCAWHATSETEFHTSQTGAHRGVVLPLLPGYTRFVQTVAYQLETRSTVPRIGPCGERTLRPPWPCVDDDDGKRYPQACSDQGEIWRAGVPWLWNNKWRRRKSHQSPIK